MTNTEPLYAASDDAAGELTALDRQTALAKDKCREVILWFSETTRIGDAGGRCYTAILEAIDDMVFEVRAEISERLADADRAIEDAERAA